MHHSFVRCNYSPYSTLWDRVFGTFKPFELSRAVRAAPSGTATPPEMGAADNVPVLSQAGATRFASES